MGSKHQENTESTKLKSQVIKNSIVDVKITIDTFQGDEIYDTINYENVVDDVIGIVKTESFNLIETLSKKITQEIYKKYNSESNVKIFEIIVTVHKPDTILKEKQIIYQLLTVKNLNSIYLSLGSNIGDRADNLTKAIVKLSKKIENC